MDTGDEGEIAFLGGINLNPNSLVDPGHPCHQGGTQNHDVYVEIAGPSTVDVHHNFVQRWNEASERFAGDGRWGRGSENDLPFPTRIVRWSRYSALYTLIATRTEKPHPKEPHSLLLPGSSRSLTSIVPLSMPRNALST
jgi:phosphatidylserine/phosphatidylglycerophosphate/cardiolipin synthase-like enzyme